MPDPLDITDISVAENGKYNDCVVFKLQLFCAKQLVTPPLSNAAASSFYPQTDCLGTMVHVTLDSKLTSEKIFAIQNTKGGMNMESNPEKACSRCTTILWPKGKIINLKKTYFIAQHCTVPIVIFQWDGQQEGIDQIHQARCNF